ILCTNKVDWDETLTGDLLSKFQTVIREIPCLHSVRVPRCYFDVTSKPTEVELHGFSDASSQAAVVYIRSVYENGGVRVNLVASKSRVAPLKRQTIPRLELLGAMLLARLCEKITRTVGELPTTYWIERIATQRCSFPEEVKLLSEFGNNVQTNLKSKVKQFGLYFDGEGVMRSCGRVNASSLRPNSKNPIFLPSKHQFVELLIRHTHNQIMHSGVRDTLTTLRERFWILRGRETIKKIIRHCVVCRKMTVQPSKSTRFSSRRGLSATITSDNAKAFKSSSKDIGKIIRSQEVCGFWEQLVRSVKRPLKHVVGRSTLTYDELHTILVEIEAIVNACPLAYVYDDEESNYEPLTPSNLIYGRRITTSPNSSHHEVMSTNRSLTRRARHHKHLLEQVTKQWRREYLTSLCEQASVKSKANGSGSSISQGDVVIGRTARLDQRLLSLEVATQARQDDQSNCCYMTNRLQLFHCIPIYNTPCIHIDCMTMYNIVNYDFAHQGEIQPLTIFH
ncbi:Hypothetical predicted protein, partial [Paramuricea clavata]